MYTPVVLFNVMPLAVSSPPTCMRTPTQIMFLEDMFTNAAAAGGGKRKGRGTGDMDDDPDMADPSLGTSSDNPTLLYLKGLLAWKQVRGGSHCTAWQRACVWRTMAAWLWLRGCCRFDGSDGSTRKVVAPSPCPSYRV